MKYSHLLELLPRAVPHAEQALVTLLAHGRLAASLKADDISQSSFHPCIDLLLFEWE